MAEDEQGTESIETIISSSQPASFIDLQTPDKSPLDQILDQRGRHRDSILRFAMWIAGLSLFVFFCLISLEMFVKLKIDPAMTLFSKYQLEVLSVAVFGQSFGIIIKITKSLWDDSPYKELLFSKEFSKKNRYLS